MPTFVESIHQPLPLFQRNPVVDYLVTVLTLIVVYLVRTRYRHGLNKIPGPFLASFTSLWKWDVVRREKMPFVNTELHEKHGPLVRIGPNHISASSAESIQTVHRVKSGFTKVLTLCFPLIDINMLHSLVWYIWYLAAELRRLRLTQCLFNPGCGVSCRTQAHYGVFVHNNGCVGP